MVILGAVIVIGLIIKNGTLNCAFGGYIISRYFCDLFQPHIINQIAGVEQMTTSNQVIKVLWMLLL
jgi:hypothetical protein